MPKKIPPPNVEDAGAPFHQYLERLREIGASTTPTLEQYLALGHTEVGARWMVEQDAAETAQQPPEETTPEETTPDWIAAIEPLSPGEVLTVYEAAIAFRDRRHLPKPRRVEDIEHWLGRPYEHELPDPLSVTLEEPRPPESEAEHNRRISWAVACELLADIADGTIPTLPGRQVGETPYAQVIRRSDFLLWAKARAGYGEVVSELLRQQEIHEQAAPEPAPVSAETASIEQLAEWVFVRHSSPPFTFDKLLAAAATEFKELKKGHFRAAYRKVYYSKPQRPPMTGWPLRDPYKKRAEEVKVSLESVFSRDTLNS